MLHESREGEEDEQERPRRTGAFLLSKKIGD